MISTIHKILPTYIIHNTTQHNTTQYHTSSLQQHTSPMTTRAPPPPTSERQERKKTQTRARFRSNVFCQRRNQKPHREREDKSKPRPNLCYAKAVPPRKYSRGTPFTLPSIPFPCLGCLHTEDVPSTQYNRRGRRGRGKNEVAKEQSPRQRITKQYVVCKA